MKKIKAFAALLCAGAVTASVFAFSGCKTNTSGVINGNYKEATAQEFTTAVETIDTENLFTVEENTEKFGYEFYTGANAKATYGGGKLGEAFEVSASTNAEVKFILEKTNDSAYNLKGAGALSFQLLSNIDKLGNNKLSADFYADNLNLYLNANMTSSVTGTEQTSSFKYKIPYATIEDIITGVIGGISPTAEGSISGSFNLAQIASLAINLGFKTYLDFSNGIKLKITADKEAVAKLLQNIDSDVAAMVTLGDSSKLEIYFSVDKAGKFAGFATNYNISATIAVADGDFVTVSTTNASSLKVYTGTIKFPANFDDYYEIPDFGGYSVSPYIA